MVLQKFMKFLVKSVKYEDLDASLKEVGRILISTSRRLIPNLFVTWNEIYNLTQFTEGVPCGIGGERWTCDPRVSGLIPGAVNLKKLLIWMKIHGLPQES